MGNQHGKERRNYVRRIDWDNAEKPSPPGKPYLDPDCEDQDFITIRWSPPVTDGGAPILGYVVEHRRTGSPHWLRAIPYLAEDTQLTLTGLEPGWRYQFRVSAENDIGRSPPGDISDVMTVTSQRTAATSPHFNVELHDTVALENEKVEFTVHVVAIPQAKISWYKDGFEVFSSRRMKIVTENDQSTFIIHQAALEDEGEIKCTATNRAGHSVTKAILKLEAPPRIRLPRQYEDGLLFEKGELIRLKVSTAGRPPPMVTWYHNGEQIQNGDKYEIQDAERSSSLRISEAQREDRGEYQIRGINKIGEDVASFLVTVTDRPSHPGKPKVTMALGRSVTLSWESPDDDGGCKIGSYTVEYFRVGWNMWLKAVTCRQLTTDLSDLIEGSEYKFRIKAENPYGMSDPSEESDTIFIPDPKRGILTPLPKTEATKTSEMHWSSDTKKTTTEPADDKLEKRRLLEENARKLLDTPLAVILSQENTAKASKAPPSLSPEPGKRTWEDVGTENIPPPVPKRRHRQRSTPSPNPPVEIDLPTVEQEQQMDVDDEKDKNRMVDVEEYPREKDHTMFHGSSEIMLLLLPEEKPKSAELSAQQRSEIEMSLIGEGIAPPMSLSAPELGSGEPIALPPMRDAVSSTELLHERVMSRLYQDAMDEEAQKPLRRRYSGDRRSVERRNSFREGSLLERRHSFKDTPLPEAKDLNTQPKSRIPVREKREKAPAREEEVPVSEMKKSLIPLQKSPERMSSVEREQMEFALVRERIRLKNEQKIEEQRERERERMTKYRSSGGSRQQSMSSASSHISSYGDEDEEEVEEEEEDYLEEEEEEEEDLEEEIKTPPAVPRHEMPKAPFAEEEDDTCLAVTSRIVLPRLEITLPPTEEVPEPTPKQLEMPTPEPEEESYEEVPTKIPVKKGKAAKFFKKLGLKKREKKVPEIIIEMDNSASASPLPRPILKNKPSIKKKEKGRKADEQISTSCEETSDDGLSRKKKVRIAEPSASESTGPAKAKSLTEDEQATQVLIYHYSDIVREFGHGKKPTPKVCLSCDEMKALAEADAGSSPLSESVPSLSSDMEERGSPIDLSEVDSVASSSTNVADETVKPERAGELSVDARPTSPRTVQASDMKVRTSIDYLTDVAMFCVACWLYLFKDELYAIPVLFVMAYRQMSEAAREKYESVKTSFTKRFSGKNRTDDNG